MRGFFSPGIFRGSHYRYRSIGIYNFGTTLNLWRGSLLP